MEALEDHLVLGQSAWKNSKQRLRSGEKSIVIIKLLAGQSGFNTKKEGGNKARKRIVKNKIKIKLN